MPQSPNPISKQTPANHLSGGARSTVRLDALLLAGFCAFLFFWGLSSFGLIGADEPRYAQVAQEMFSRHDWITPTLGGKAWLEKPALYYWQTMLAYRIFGVSDWAARLGSAVDATMMVVAVYFFLRRFRFGVPSAGFQISDPHEERSSASWAFAGWRSHDSIGLWCGWVRARGFNRYAAGGDVHHRHACLVCLA